MPCFVALSVLSIFPMVSLSGCAEKAVLMPSVKAHCLPTKCQSAPVLSLSREALETSGLRTHSANLRWVENDVNTTGEVLADANLVTRVNPTVAGRIEKVMVQPGDYVKAGQTVMVVRSTDIESVEAELLQNIAQVKSDLEKDLLQIDSDISLSKAQCELSRRTYERVKSLLDEKIASRAEFESAETQKNKDNISLQTLQSKRTETIALSKRRMDVLMEPLRQRLALMGVSDAQLDRIIRTGQIETMVDIRATACGVVCQRDVNQGETVDPNRCLMTIGNFEKVWLKADVHEKDIEKLSIGEPITLSVDSFPGKVFRGKLDYVCDSVNPDTRTLPVRAEVVNPNHLLKPNMFARMNIIVGRKQVLTVPDAAVQSVGAGNVVYVALNSDSFQERAVTLGTKCGTDVEVLSGVHAGETVVTDGSFSLCSQCAKLKD